jgi:serine/threonine protein kinase
MLGMEQSELGGCRLTRQIGAGAMGEVYLAEQVRLGNRLVAVKVVRAEQDASLPDGAVEDVERRFIHEAQLLGQLTHPNILPVYHSGIEAGYLFLVMQYAPDGSLADAIKGKGPHRLDLPASLPLVVDIIGQVADALQYTHEHRVIHADVKPGNVLMQVEPNGHVHVLLADFGIAQSWDSIASRNEVAGTLAYMAPEQFYGQVSAACDQYALGVMAFQLLAGRTPFVGGIVEIVQAHAHEQPPALGALNPAVAPAVEEVILRSLAKQPTDRYPSVAAFAEALRAAVMGAGTVVDASTRGVGGAFLRRPEVGPSGISTRAAPAAIPNEPAPAATARPPMASLTRPAAAGAPATSPKQSRARRRIAPGLAVIALLLVAGIAAIGLRTHIDSIRASSAPGKVGGTSQTPTATSAPAVTNPASSPNGAYTPQAPFTPPFTLAPTPAPTAPPTGKPTRQPTGKPTATAPTSPTPPSATAVPQPTAMPTTPATSPTATAAPEPTATTAPEPTATAPAPPTPPSATAVPQPPVTPPAPATPQPAS